MLLHQKLFLLLLLLLPTQLGKHFWPDWSFVRGLRVDYLSPTVYLTDLLVFLILGVWTQENLKSKSKILKLLFFPTSVFIFLLFNCLFAQNQGAAFYKLLKIVEFSLLGFYVARNANSVSRITYHVLPWTVIYSSLLALAQFLKQSSLNGIFYWLGERTFNAGTPGIAKISLGGWLLMRPYATFPHPNVLAGFILVSLILTCNPALPDFDGELSRTAGRPKLVTQKLVNWIALFFGIITILISFSRATWVVGMLVVLLLIYRFRRLRVMGCVLIVAGAAALLLSAFGGKLPFFSEESLVQRMELNRIALKFVGQSPLIGVGLNNFIVRLPEFWRGSTYWLQPVHNIYLLITAETGIVGLLIFLWFIFLTYKKLDASRYTLATSLIVILLLGFFDHYWLTLQQTQLLFAIVLGLAWKSVKIAS